MKYQSYPTVKTMKRKQRKTARNEVYMKNKRMSRKYRKRNEETKRV